VAGHENEIILRDMLDGIKYRVNDMGYTIPVSVHRIRAHVGVHGNKRADTLANSAACEEPRKAKVVDDGSRGGPRRVVKPSDVSLVLRSPPSLMFGECCA